MITPLNIPLSTRMDRMPTKYPSNSYGHGAYVRCAQMTIEVLFQGKWQVNILCAMRHGPVRIGQLGRMIPGASKKVLAQSLRKLEASGIVARRDLSDLVLHVEYELQADLREDIIALLDHLSAWGSNFLQSEGSKGRLRKPEG
jgi:DNA-binding HxlR family transcriptional regulator